MVSEGADILDVGGESTRPGPRDCGRGEERDRVVPVIRADPRGTAGDADQHRHDESAVAEAALDAGANLLNDVWGTSESTDLARIAAERGVPSC